jgi:GxxExxY protein
MTAAGTDDNAPAWSECVLRDRRREEESLVAGAVVRTRALGRTRTEDHDRLTGRIIGCAIEVHRMLGPGLLESAYEEALCVELEEAGLAYQRQLPVPIKYKGRTLGEYRLDLLVEDAVVVEVKSTERDDPVFMSQLLTYIRLTGKRVGLLINFNRRLLKNGITRMVV